MSLTDVEIQRRMDLLADRCASAGVRVTRQRREVFCELARTEAHPAAETVWRRVRERLPRLSLDTVYRTLAGLEELGLLQRLAGTGGNATRFDANPCRHYHFVCDKCGLIRDFHSPQLDSFTPPPELESLGRVEGLYVEARGRCKDCLKLKPRRSRSAGMV
jgi:Fur family peroxide stress response transcriptional regulator